MNQIYYFFLLFSLLFLLETKAINILISFITLLISVALLLPSLHLNINGLEGNLQSIEGEFFSYILILVQVSALTILFGFIIMLFPSLSHSSPITNSIQFSDKSFNLKSITLTFIILFFFFFLLLYLLSSDTIFSFFSDILFSPFSNNSYNPLTFSYNKESGISLEEYNFSVLHNDSFFLRKIGYSLYSFDNSIFKLILITIILLLAIISLSFLFLLFLKKGLG